MLKKIKDVLLVGGPWPIVALIIAGGVIFAAIAIFAPPETRTALFGAHGFLMTIIALLVGSPLGSGDEPPKPPGT